MPVLINLAAATTVLVNLSIALQNVSRIVQSAQTEGRDLTEGEMKGINDSFEQSFKELDIAIANKEKK